MCRSFLLFFLLKATAPWNSPCGRRTPVNVVPIVAGCLDMKDALAGGHCLKFISSAQGSWHRVPILPPLSTRTARTVWLAPPKAACKTLPRDPVSGMELRTWQSWAIRAHCIMRKHLLKRSGVCMGSLRASAWKGQPRSARQTVSQTGWEGACMAQRPLNTS